jgi:hypothetical protein
MQAETRVNVEQASKRAMRKPTRLRFGEGRRLPGQTSDSRLEDSAGVVTSACMEEEVARNTGSPLGGERDRQPEPRERPAGPLRVAERPVVVRKPGNAGGAKGPRFRVSVVGDRARRLA